MQRSNELSLAGSAKINVESVLGKLREKSKHIFSCPKAYTYEQSCGADSQVQGNSMAREQNLT